mgnify:CR=1 FL=1
MWDIGEAAGRPDWRVLDTRLSCNLYAVVGTVEGPHAIGGRGVLAADRGSGWEVVFDDGPATRQNQIRSVDATDDGKRFWIVGSGGSIACYDVVERRRFDYSYPEELTSTWEGIAVSGERGSEKALTANGSGEVLPFAVDGTDPDWGHLDRVAQPGATVDALGSTPDGVGFAVDTNGRAHKTTHEEGWTSIGVLDTRASFTDIDAGPDEQVYVTADDGRIYRYGNTYHSWTPIEVGEGVAIRTVDVFRGRNGRRQMTALSENGRLYERVASERWERRPVPTNDRLYDISLGDPDLVVGRSGTVLERPRSSTAADQTLTEADHSAVYETPGIDRVDTE